MGFCNVAQSNALDKECVRMIDIGAQERTRCGVVGGMVGREPCSIHIAGKATSGEQETLAIINRLRRRDNRRLRSK